MAQRYDLIIVGMGSGGMVAAEFAATLDLKIAAVERDRMGGDCLWTGCVPSKALLASAKGAHHMRTADHYGIAAGEPQGERRRGWGILPRDEPALVEILVDKLRSEGLDLAFNVETQRVTVEDGVKVVHGTQDGEPRTWRGEEILVGVGRRPNVEGLGLDELGIETNRRGVTIDARSRTNVPSVYAIGDLGGRHLFTPPATYEG